MMGIGNNQLMKSNVAGSISGKYILGFKNQEQTVYLSKDGGLTFNLAITDYGTYFYDIAVSGTGQYMIAGGSSTGKIYVSNNYGTTWSVYTSFVQPYGVSISQDGQYVVATNLSFGLSYSSDFGVTFSSIFGINKPNRVAISNDGQYITITPSNISDDYLRVSNDAGVSWTTITDYAPTNWIDIAMSGSGQYQTAVGNGYIYKSDDYGVTWAQVGLSGTKNCIGMSLDGQYQYYGYSLIYKSIDYGATWSSIYGGSAFGYQGINDITVSEDGQIIVVGVGNTATGFGIYKSIDGGTSFTKLSFSKAFNRVAINNIID